LVPKTTLKLLHQQQGTSRIVIRENTNLFLILATAFPKTCSHIGHNCLLRDTHPLSTGDVPWSRKSSGDIFSEMIARKETSVIRIVMRKKCQAASFWRFFNKTKPSSNSKSPASAGEETTSATISSGWIFFAIVQSYV
jgi:hypothetical protein